MITEFFGCWSVYPLHLPTQIK